MKKIIYVGCFVSIIAMTMCLLVSCGGGGGDTIEEDTKQSQNNSNSGQTQDATEGQQKSPAVIVDITNSTLDTSGDNVIFSFEAPFQVGGKAELFAMDSNDTKKVVLGTYNTEKGCYEFNLSELEEEKSYTFKIKVYDKAGTVVVESTESVITMPDMVEHAKFNPSGESDGTRSY